MAGLAMAWGALEVRFWQLRNQGLSPVWLGVWALALVGSPPAPAQATLSALVREAESLGVTTGVLVRDSGADRPLFTHNGAAAFAPASNMKLVSAVAVAAGLGSEYRFRTHFEVREGVLHVLAGGDPLWRSGTSRDPVQILGLVVERLRTAGLERIRGVSLDHGSFTGPGRPASWPRDQLDRYYCAPTGGLVLEEGCFRLRIRASSRAAADVSLLGPFRGSAPVTGRIAMTTSRKEGSLYGVRDNGGTLHLFGHFYSRAAPVDVLGAVRDPAMWFQKTLEHALAAGGVRVDPEGPAVDLELPPHETPLEPALRRSLVHSSNFTAEQTLRVLGAELLGDGSLAGGVRAMEQQLQALVGNLPRSTRLVDGSGLSRNNRITPALLAELLLWAVSEQPALVGLLPRTAGPGTLAQRFAGSAVASRVSAKTGWISGASALSGVLELQSGHPRVFSILMNYDPGRSGLNARLKKLQERMVEAMDSLPESNRVRKGSVLHEPIP